MKPVVFRTKEYCRTTQAWWYMWHGTPINERLLSRFGVAICEDEQPLAIGYIYPASTCDMAMLGFTVRDPYISKFKAGKALMLLLTACEDEVRALGYSVLYTGFDAQALQSLCERRGYHQGSQVQEYFKELM